MRVKRKTIIGKISTRGELSAPWDVLKDFCSLNKERAVIIRVEVQPKEPSEKLRNFVFGYAVPEMQRVFHENGEDYTKAQTFEALKRLCPVFLDEQYGADGWHTRVKEWEELDSAEAVEFVAWLQRFAAENYYSIIQDPE